jgi:uncharacterized protein (TIGR02996 family)
VSEDEAFIRAVVDSPGDDTPRLVYADWLDDRDDPRGPYLRAEMKCATKPKPAAMKKLLKLGKPLDAVWVARVSRPPVGVCIQTSYFRRYAPPATAKKIDAMAKEFGVIFPPEYRAFLLNFNGGWLAVYPDDEEPDESNEVLGDVAWMTTSARELFARTHASNRHCGLFPIGALAGAAGHNTLLGVGLPNTAPSKLLGGVFYSCRDSEPWTANGEFIEVENWDHKTANSLPEFLAGWERDASEDADRD